MSRSVAPRVIGLVAAALLPLSVALGALTRSTLVPGFARLAFASVVPGWLILALAGRHGRGDLKATVLRALVLSPLVYAATTLLLRLGLGIEIAASAWLAAWILCVALAAASLLGFTPAHAGAGSTLPEERGAESTLLGLAPVVALAATTAVVLVSPGARLSYHGLLHGGIVAQITTGIVPPENPALAGEPIGFYWLYHWLLAAQGELAGLSILETSPLLDGISLVVYVGASQRLLRRFLSPPGAALGALAAGFAGNLLFPLVFAVELLRLGPPPDFFWPFELLERGVVAGDPRLATLFGKFLNLGGFPLGLALFAVLLDELVPARARRPRALVVFLALAGTVLFHTTTALAAVPALGAAHLATCAGEGRARLATLMRAVLPMAGVFVAALVATAPYLLSVTAASHGWSPFPPERAVLAYNASGIAASATPLLAVVLLGVRRAWADPPARFLWIATALLLALGTLLSLPDHNQYKLPLLAALPGGALLCRWLRPDPESAATFPRRTLFAALVGLAVASHAITAAAYLLSGMPGRRDVAGDGGYLAFPTQPELDRALRWLRSNTPAAAVLVSKPVPFNDSPLGVGSGRGAFVLEGGHHTQGNPLYPRRYRLAQRLFSPDGYAGPIATELRAELDRPLYVLLPRSWHPGGFEALVEKLSGSPEAFVEVYRAEGAVIWTIRDRAQ